MQEIGFRLALCLYIQNQPQFIPINQLISVGVIGNRQILILVDENCVITFYSGIPETEIGSFYT